MKRIIRNIVDNLLSGTKAGFKAIRNFEHQIERKKMDNQKSKSTFSVILLALILGLIVLWTGPAALTAQEMVLDPSTGEMVEKPKYGGTLTFASNQEPANSDMFVGGLSAGRAFSGVLEKLSIADWAVDRSVNNLRNEFYALEDQIRPALAASWENPDPNTYIFHIRQGVHWHKKAPMNGRELTAEDVVFNYHRLTGMGSGFSKPEGLSSTLVSLEFESISASDKYTVVVKLKKLRIDALWWLVEDNFGWISPPEVIKQHGDTADWRNLVGTGPLELTDWVEGSSLTWTKNPDYWGTDEKYPRNRLPYIDTLRSLIMKDEATRLAVLRSGKVDYIGANAGSAINTPDAVESIERTNPDLKVWPYYFRSNAGMAYDVTKPPFNDIRVRKALQMAVDLETINDTYYKGLAVATPQGVTGNFQTPFAIHYDEWPEEIRAGYRYDPEAAERLLDEAGYPRGENGIRFKTHMDGLIYIAFNPDYFAIVIDYWRKIGVQAELKLHETTAWVSRAQKHEFEGMSWTTAANVVHPLITLPGYTTGHVGNKGQVDDPKYNALYESMKAATSVEELGNYAKQADLYVVSQHWHLWGPIEPSYNVIQPWVKGHNGEFYMGVWNKNAVYVRLWIDQELKKKMGF